jgi:hypothetical protein
VLRQSEVLAEAQTPSLSATLVSGALVFFVKTKKIVEELFNNFFAYTSDPPPQRRGAAAEQRSR